MYILKIVYKWRSLIDLFPVNYCSAFFYSRSFSCALYFDYSSWQESDEKLQDTNILIKMNFFLFEKRLFWKKLFISKNYVFEKQI